MRARVIALGDHYIPFRGECRMAAMDARSMDGTWTIRVRLVRQSGGMCAFVGRRRKRGIMRIAMWISIVALSAGGCGAGKISPPRNFGDLNGGGGDGGGPFNNPDFLGQIVDFAGGEP